MAGRMRQRVHETVDERPFRRHQLRVLAAAGVDGEGLPSEGGRDLVGVQARGVDDNASQDAFGGRLKLESEEHTSELQSSQISYAVFCLKKKREWIWKS